jgi:hypothetical protein
VSWCAWWGVLVVCSLGVCLVGCPCCMFLRGVPGGGCLLYVP